MGTGQISAQVRKLVIRVASQAHWGQSSHSEYLARYRDKTGSKH